MLAFHNDPQIKFNLVEQLKNHYDADEIVKGKYWEDGKGCAVGCCVHSSDHNLFPEFFGIPADIAYLMDGIFENLPNGAAKEFPLQVIDAIAVGADLSKIKHFFLEWLLIDPEYGVARFNSDPSIAKVAQLHSQAGQGASISQESWAAARDAASDAAWDAARDAAWDTAWAAAWDTAWAAAWDTDSDAAWDAASDAARAAASDAAGDASDAAGDARDAARAARDAARAAQAKRLTSFLAAAPVPKFAIA